MAYRSEDAARIFEALGDPTRRAVFERLAEGAVPVADIARGMTVSRPAVSQHLRVLKGAGLVTDRREGTRRLYAIREDGLADLRAYVDGFWDRALAGFKRHSERERTIAKGDGDA